MTSSAAHLYWLLGNRAPVESNRCGLSMSRVGSLLCATLRCVAHVRSGSHARSIPSAGADGSSVSLSTLGDALRGTPSMDQISAVQAQVSEWQKEVKFWLGECEG